MKYKLFTRRILLILAAAAMTAVMMAPFTACVHAANYLYITEINIEAGAGASQKLEADGWSVMMSGLNAAADESNQVYMAYKTNTGDPITNIILSTDVGDSLTDKNGIEYICASHVDVDAGIGGNTGCVYFTCDKKAGAPIVGLDVLRSRDEAIYPITNDGAEIVREASGVPADFERASDSAVIYLAQIRDGIVRPYISEIGVVTDTDKWNAVYTACERGYNYYVEGDLDDAAETYTILVYQRTANAEDALTNIAAVSADTIQSMEKNQIVDASAGASEKLTGAAISISGMEYVRVSGKAVDAEQPYFLYQTKNKDAGNPVSMLYAETIEEKQNFLFGTWANAYFFSPGVTTAYTYSLNENLAAKLADDLTVFTKRPVQLLDSVTPMPATAAETQNAAEEQTTTAVQTTAPVHEESGAQKYVRIAMLTPRDGLPASAVRINGLRDNLVEPPVVERNERSERINKFQSSVFGKDGGLALIAGGSAIVAAVVSAIIIRKKHPDKNSSGKSKGAR